MQAKVDISRMTGELLAGTLEQPLLRVPFSIVASEDSLSILIPDSQGCMQIAIDVEVRYQTGELVLYVLTNGMGDKPRRITLAEDASDIGSGA
jgi:hypothetical protein